MSPKELQVSRSNTERRVAGRPCWQRCASILRSAAATLIVAAGLCATGMQIAQAVPAPAGSIVRNIATATYVPAGYSQSETVSSNEVLASIQAVEALTLTQSQSVTRPASVAVTLSHLLTNTGNTASNYTLSFTNGGSGCAADDFDLSSLRVVRDVNNNGVMDAADAEVALATPGAVTLQPGAATALLVQGFTPALTSGTACLTLTATTALQGITAVNNNRVTLGANAVLTLRKSASYGGFVIPGSTEIHFTIEGTSIGAHDAAPVAAIAPLGTPILVDSAPRTLVLIRDLVPAGLRYIDNSLQTAAPGAIKLFRLPGDAPYSYRTADGGATAIEIAIGLPGPLVRNGAASMSFSARVIPGFAGNIINNAQGYFHDGTQGVETPSNTVVIAPTPGRLGLAKRAGAVRVNADASGNPDSTVNVSFALRLKNYGSLPLYDVQLTDLLAGGGATQFGAYTPQAVPGHNQYTVVAGSLAVSANPGNPVPGTVVAVNPAFTGEASSQNLLAPGAVLPAGAEFTVVLELRVNLFGRTGTLLNTARAGAALAAGTPPSVFDDSTDGTDPDADADGDPGNNSTPTPIATRAPLLALTKNATLPRRLSETTFEIDYHFTVTNTGTVPAPNVRLLDNLNCTFEMDLPTGRFASWELVGAPTSQRGVLLPARTFTGNTTCDRAGQSSTSAMSSVPYEVALSLIDGSRPLLPGQADTIRLTVRATLKASAAGGRTVVTNKAWAASFESNAINVNPSMLVAATAATTQSLLADPMGVVYDAVTRQPVAGAVVTFTRSACSAGPATAITAADIANSGVPGLYTFNGDGSLSMTTAADGAYQFYLQVPPVNDVCTFKLTVLPPAGSGYVTPSALLPAQPGTFAACGAIVPNAAAPQGSEPTTHFFSVRAGIDGNTQVLCEALHNHIPLDPGSASGLALRKEASKGTVEFGDFLDYALTLTNKTGLPVTGATFSDTLPPGLAYIMGSARLNGQVAADPAGGTGPVLVFSHPVLQLAPDASATVRYRVRVGVGAPTEGEAINRAIASSGTFTSNLATHRLRISGGVFADDAYAFGKVYLDCNRDAVQSGGQEVGIPGVRLFLENGTSVVTDIEGKWSLYGLKPVTHVLRVDESTLPRGARLALLDNRNSGEPNSRFVDARKGEFHKADFIVGTCDDTAMVAAVQTRRAALARRGDLDGTLVNQRLDAEGKPVATGDLRALPARGDSTPTGGASGATPVSPPLITLPPSLMPATGASGFTSSGADVPGALARSPASSTPVPAANALVPEPAPGPIELEDMMPSLDNQLAFIELKDGDTVPSQTTNVRVKGVEGTRLLLAVNGQAVDERRVGKKAVLPINKLAAWEYIGVLLQPGANTLRLEMMDDMGNLRGTQQIRVTAPDKLARVEIDLPAVARADERTPVAITLRLTDAGGVPVTARTQVTLESDRGRWLNEDLNPMEPGTQIFMEGGTAELQLLPPGVPGDARIRVSTGNLVREVRLSLLPELRPLIGAGIIEGVIDFTKRGTLKVGEEPAGAAFEQELSGMTGDVKGARAAGRAAFFFKGTIKGEYLLTAAYDSDKTSRDRLFRDIRPDEFYPVYGDSATRSFDAQSTQKLYVRIDKDRSWLLYGDFTTASSPEVRQLSQTNRSLTGIKHVYENGRARVTSYLSRTAQTQQVEEFQAVGTSGPYFLAPAGGEFVTNSENVEILVRDRNSPGTVLQVTPVTRFVDYTVEPLTRRILFTRAIASVDANLNPQSIRVSYEVESGGPEFTVAGADMQVKVSDNLQVGIVSGRDGNPANPRKLAAATALAKIGDNTVFSGEVVSTTSALNGSGTGVRVELRHQDERLAASAQALKTTEGFDNPGASFPAGRVEATARAEYRVDATTVVRAEALSAKVLDAPSQRGISASVQKKLGTATVVEIGVRHGDSNAASTSGFDYGQVSTYNGASGNVGAAPVTALGAATGAPDITTVRARLTTDVPGLPQARAFVEGEQDIEHSDRRVLAVGGNYALTDKTRAYGRYELISSLYGPWALEAGRSSNTGILGVESSYMEGGRVFNEYRIADSADGRSVNAAMGVRNTFAINKAWRLTAGIEHTRELGTLRNSGNTGTGYAATTGNSTAVIGGAEHLGERIKASLVAEARTGADAATYLLSAGVGAKIDEDWSLLSRAIISNSDGRGANAGNDRQLGRFQIGAAWRPVDQNVWNALARYEHRFETVRGAGTAAGAAAIGAAALPGEYSSDIVSAHINYNPRRGTYVAGRYAGKISRADDGSLSSTYWAHLLHARYTVDVSPDWDVGVQAGVLWGKGGARKATLGIETGWQAAKNLWLSAGYNFIGLNDRELAGADYTSRGLYLRLRFKFDESSLSPGASGSVGAAEGRTP